MTRAPFVPHNTDQAPTSADPTRGMQEQHVRSGLAHFRAGKYELALRDFSEAIELQPRDAKLFDSRAATYEKLGWSRSALEDAKTVIKLKPDLAKGYLRAARIYESLGKPDLALRLIRAGQASVKTPISAFDTEASKLMAVIEKQAASPLSALPREIFVQTISCLEAAERLRCSHVCQAWRNTIESSPVLWDDLVLRASPQRAAKKLIYYRARLEGVSLCSLVIDVEFSNSSAAELGILLGLLRGIGSRLQHLQFRQSERMQDSLGDDYPVDWQDSLWQFVLGCRQTLRTLSMELRDVVALPVTLGEFAASCPRLDRLKLALIPPAHELLLRRLAPSDEIFAFIEKSDDHKDPTMRIRACQLQEVQTDSVAFRIPGEASAQTHFNNTAIRLWDYEWPRLEKLACDYQPVLGTGVFPDIANAMPEGMLLKELPMLREARLRKTICAQSWVLLAVSRAPLLERVVMTGFDSKPTCITLARLAESSPLLESINLSGCALKYDGLDFASLEWPSLLSVDLSYTSFDDAALTKLGETAAKIECLNVNSCTALTSGPVMRFVDAKRGQIKQLSIDSCLLVKAEAVDWLRKVVPKLSAKMGDPTRDKTWRGRFT